jgi:hypothetical protein
MKDHLFVFAAHQPAAPDVDPNTAAASWIKPASVIVLTLAHLATIVSKKQCWHHALIHVHDLDPAPIRPR